MMLSLLGARLSRLLLSQGSCPVPPVYSSFRSPCVRCPSALSPLFYLFRFDFFGIQESRWMTIGCAAAAWVGGLWGGCDVSSNLQQFFDDVYLYSLGLSMHAVSAPLVLPFSVGVCVCHAPAH